MTRPIIFISAAVLIVTGGAFSVSITLGYFLIRANSEKKALETQLTSITDELGIAKKAIQSIQAQTESKLAEAKLTASDSEKRLAAMKVQLEMSNLKAKTAADESEQANRELAMLQKNLAKAKSPSTKKPIETNAYVTRDNYNLLKSGLSIPEVESILGKGKETSSDVRNVSMEWRSRPDRGAIVIAISFRNELGTMRLNSKMIFGDD